MYATPSSYRQRLGVVADGLVEVLELEGLMTALRDLADDASWLAGDDAEAGNDHVGRDDGAVEDAYVVLDDGEFAHHNARPNVHVAAYRRRLHHGALAHEDLVA